MIRRLLHFLRELLAEWAFALTLPFRFFAPRALRFETARDTRAAILGGGDVVRATGTAVWTVALLPLWLARQAVALPGNVWSFLRTSNPRYLLIVLGITAALGIAVS